MGWRYCGWRICVTRVSERDSSVFSSSPKAGHFLPTAKLLCFETRMTTSVDCKDSVGSWKNVNQDAMGVDVNLFRLSSSCCFHLWLPMLTTHQTVGQGSSTSNETDCSLPCKQIRRAMEASKNMKWFSIWCETQPGYLLKVSGRFQAVPGRRYWWRWKFNLHKAFTTYAFHTVCWMWLDCRCWPVWLLFLYW